MGDRDIEKLQTALAGRERGRGKRYTPNLKQRIAEVARVLRGRGQGWHTIGRFFGVPHETVRRFAGENPAPAFVPVEVVDAASAGLTLVTPDGYRVEGLSPTDVAEILRRLR